MTRITDARAIVDQLDEWERAHATWRGTQTINLNAATNSLSARARAALATSSADKGISSGLHSRHHLGGRFIDLIEAEIERVACELFGAEAADLRAPSGSLANAIVVASLVPHDRSIMVGGPGSLGHFSYRQEGWGGRLTAEVVELPMTADGTDLDLDSLARVARRTRPGMIIVGTQAMLFPVDLLGLRAVADEVGALVVYDAAHPLGLIAGGEFQDPLAEGADIVAASTQKTLPGPVGGIILTRSAAVMKPIYDATNYLMSNYQNNRVLSLGYALLEMAAFGPAYAAACIANARTFGAALAERDLVPLFADRGFTRSNQLLLAWGGKLAADDFAARCERANVIVSTVRVPSGDPDQLVFGTRIGLQDVTRHGYGPDDLAEVADVLAAITRGVEPESVRDRVSDLAGRRTRLSYCFA